jgi:HPt (histidine-containing phosphotransfer) domain-containing protein
MKPGQEISDSETRKLDIPVFNALKNIFGDAFKDAVDKHSKSAKKNIQRVEQALEANDANELERAAHSIKGASAQFGASSLSAVSMKIEQLGKEGKLEEAKLFLEKLKIAQADAENEMNKNIN